MTDIEQEFALAKVQGWKIENYGPMLAEFAMYRLMDPAGRIACDGQTNKETAMLQFRLLLPNYLGDLNAIHALVHSQPEKIQKAIRFHLFVICGQMKSSIATAPQMCEATLKALNLWQP